MSAKECKRKCAKERKRKSANVRAQKSANVRAQKGAKERKIMKIANNEVWNNKVWELPTYCSWTISEKSQAALQSEYKSQQFRTMVRGSLRGVWIKGALNLTIFGIPSFGILALGTPVLGIPDFGIPGFGNLCLGESPSVGFPYLRNPCFRNPWFRNPWLRTFHLRNFLWRIVCRVKIWRLSFQKLLKFSTCLWEHWVKSDGLDRQVVVWPVSGTVTQCWDCNLWKPFGQHTAMKKCVRKMRKGDMRKILREKPCEK